MMKSLSRLTRIGLRGRPIGSPAHRTPVVTMHFSATRYLGQPFGCLRMRTWQPGATLVLGTQYAGTFVLRAQARAAQTSHRLGFARRRAGQGTGEARQGARYTAGQDQEAIREIP